MKTRILTALIILTALASCTVTQPEEGVYYPQQRVYSTPQYDPYYNQGYNNPYATRRVYDSNTGRYYDVPVYSTPAYGNQGYGAPVYSAPVYSNREYRRDDYRREIERREIERREAERREYNNNQPRHYEQPQNNDQGEKRLPDGTRIYPDGTVRLPNGEIKHR